MFIQFQIDVSKDLNGHCENPIAMYFDKTSRDRCLTEKITKKKLEEWGFLEYKKIIKKLNLDTDYDGKSPCGTQIIPETVVYPEGLRFRSFSRKNIVACSLK